MEQVKFAKERIMAILKEYELLLAEIDAWFARCQSHFPADIACGKGCSGCCRGLFDITILDAALLHSGFARLPDKVKVRLRIKAEKRLQTIQTIWPEFNHPFIINYRPEEEREALMATDNETPCVLLDDEGRCLLYAYRPMTCRLHGLPLLDISGEVMEDEWCPKNFPEIDPRMQINLRENFEQLFYREAGLGRCFTAELLGKALGELDCFIPTALLLDFSDFDWQKWFAENPLKT